MPKPLNIEITRNRLDDANAAMGEICHHLDNNKLQTASTEEEIDKQRRLNKMMLHLAQLIDEIAPAPDRLFLRKS